MAIKIGNTGINKAYLGGTEIKKLYLGANVIFDNTFTPFLNQFSGASLGLSLFLLIANYLGFCIRVRRSSDNTELDIGFVNNVLDTASLLDFVGSGNGFVSIIYDQVGSNNMVQNIASRQGQIVSNGSLILKGGKPCIVRSVNRSGGYISGYAPNDAVAVKGVFYVGDNQGITSLIFGSNTGANDFGFVAENASSSTIDSNLLISLTKLNGEAITIANRDEAFTLTNNQFLLYRESDFNFQNNLLALGYRQNGLNGFGMMTFQELVIFENTDDAVAKENNINARYNNIY
jgi:hypothetical protein